VTPQFAPLALSIAVALILAPAVAQAQYQDWEDAEDSGEADLETAPPLPGSEPRGEGGAGEEALEPEPVEEEDAELEGERPEMQGTVLLWGEVATYIGNFDVGGLSSVRISGMHLSPVVGGSYYFTDEIRANAELGLALWFHEQYPTPGGTGDETEDAGLALRFGNALLSADLVGDPRAEIRHRVGLGVTLPIATANDAAERGALQLALAERGGWDPWLWAISRMSLVATGQLETDLAEQVVVGGDAGVGVLFHAGDSSAGLGDDETVFSAQVAGNLEYRLDAVALGVRLSLVLAGEEVFQEREDFQLAVTPYGRLALGEATFLSAAFVLNVNPPYGFSFSEGEVWGVRVGVGTSL